MKADYLSFQRATSVSLLGLAVQGALAGSLIVYAVLAVDHAALTVGLFAAWTMLVWLLLAIVFDQARRERIEAIELETLGSDASRSSVFESSGDEFRVASRRLASMYRILLPIASVVIGAGLIALGWWRYRTGLPLFANYDPPAMRGWAMGLSISVAGAMFLFARYTAGMARQPVWANLRAGAAMAAGLSLMCVVMVVAHIVDIVGPDGPLRALRVIFPVLVIVLGCEVFLNFILDLYRPRRPGEIPRPSFDSRLLGFVASPEAVARSIGEAINYQIGSDVTTTWMYRLLSRWSAPIVVLAVLILWGLSAFAVIQPHQRALVLRFGSVVREDVGPGLLIKAPWPIDEVVIPVEQVRDERGKVTGEVRTATGIRQLHLATLPPTGTGAILWTNDHAREEYQQIVQPSRSGSLGERAVGERVRGDAARSISILSMEIPMFYTVTNVSLFEQLGPPDQRDDLLRATAQREIIRYVATLGVDDILGPGRLAMADVLRERIEAAYAKLNPDEKGNGRGPGIRIISVGVAGVHPPKKVAGEFEAVVGAEQNRQAKIDSATADAIATLTRVVGSVNLAEQIVNKIDEADKARAANADAATLNEKEFAIQALLDQAGGSAAAAISSAKADRWVRHMGERARANRYLGQLSSYKAAPEIFKASTYFDALTAAIAGSRLFITSDRIPDLRITTELMDRESGTDVFREIRGDDVQQ